MSAKSYPNKDALMACRILVVGDVMLDRYWFGDVERISPEAPVPVLLVSRKQERLGGAANVALNVKTLGGQVTLLSMIGQDEPARRLTELLNEQGVTAVLGQDPRLQTIVKLRLIGRSQQLMRVDFEQEPDHEVLSQMLADFKREVPLHDIVLFSDYGKGGLAHIPRMIEFARNVGKPVLVDPKGADYLRYAGASVVTPNRAEMRQVVGAWQDEVDLQRKAEVLRANLGLQALVLTRSEEGMSLFQANSVEHIKAHVREVADVNAEDRGAVLAGLSSVALVTFFDESTPVELIKRIKPDIYVKGGDYDMETLEETRVVRRWGGVALAIPFVKGYSTTSLLKRIRGG